MRGASAGSAAGQDLAALRDEFAQPRGVLVVDVLDLLHAEVTNFPPDALVLTSLAGLLGCPWRHSLSFSEASQRAYWSANGSLNSVSRSSADSRTAPTGTSPG